MTSSQLPKTRFVRDCNVKPALAKGQERVRFVEVSVKLIGGRGSSATGAEFALSPAGFDADTT